MPSQWVITNLQYLDCHDASIHAFHTSYMVGRQGGIEIIMHGERIATCGSLRLNRKDGSCCWLSKLVQRTVRDNNCVDIKASLEGYDAFYDITLKIDGDSILLTVNLPHCLNSQEITDARFSLSLFPPTLWGKTWTTECDSGYFPREIIQNIVTSGTGHRNIWPLGSGKKIAIAPCDDLLKFSIETNSGKIDLIDGRFGGESELFYARQNMPLDTSGNVLTWRITPNRIPAWKRAPMIGISQVGYHPGQNKKAIIELDSADSAHGTAILMRQTHESGAVAHFTAPVTKWGSWMRYQYAIFDFSAVTEEGVYFVLFNGSKAGPFRISHSIYTTGVWQPTLNGFFPVQMCHMRVSANGRIWHDACHLDDAIQAPPNFEYIDGYRMGASTDTPFKPQEHIPGVNEGGWHDAGDTDLAAGSQAATTYWLALAREEFGCELDETTVDRTKKLVTMYTADGIPDILQQIEHGVLNLLGGYRSVGHSFCGLIENEPDAYLMRGEVSLQTDNVVYDPALPADVVTHGKTGRCFDRYAFTNHDTALEYMVSATLAIAARTLKGYNDTLSAESLAWAEKIWVQESMHNPITFNHTYVPRDIENQKIRAAVELYISTGSKCYRNFVIDQIPFILEKPKERAWSIIRILDHIDDGTLISRLRSAIEAAQVREINDKKNPFGIYWHPHTWGVGWGLQERACRDYWLHKAFPATVPADDIHTVIHWVLGCHPANNCSLVSGIGSKSITAAFGINRADWGYIPGGVVSGLAFLAPDFTELKTDFPWLWQQSEYVMSGAGSWIFLVQAGNALLNH